MFFTVKHVKDNFSQDIILYCIAQLAGQDQRLKDMLVLAFVQSNFTVFCCQFISHLSVMHYSHKGISFSFMFGW